MANPGAYVLKVGIELFGKLKYMKDVADVERRYRRFVNYAEKSSRRLGRGAGYGGLSQKQFGAGPGAAGGGVPPGGKRPVTPMGGFFGEGPKKVTEAHSKAVNKLGMNYAKLAIRAAAVIPIWMALRSVYMAITNTIRLAITNIRDVNKALARAEAVTHNVENVKTHLEGLEKVTRTLAVETGVSMPKIIELYYRMGTAGIEGTDAIHGMNIALRTSVAMMGDGTATARAIADVYNLMGKRMVGVTSIQDKMNKIGSTMSIMWSSNAFELGEFNSALQSFVPIAQNYNLSLDEVLSLLSSLHTLAQRGSKAGNQMGRAFLFLTRNMDKAAMVLGKTRSELLKRPIFDVYLELLTKISETIPNVNKRMEVLTDIFGRKGVVATAAFATNIDMIVKQLNEISEMPLEERMRKQDELYRKQIDTIETQLKIFTELKKATAEAWAKSAIGSNTYLQSLKDLNSFMKENVIPTSIILGEIMSDITQEMKDRVNIKSAIKDPLGLSALFGVAQKITGTEVDTKPIGDRVKKRLEDLFGSIDDIEKGVITKGQPVTKVPKTTTLSNISDSYKYQSEVLERMTTLGYTQIEIEKQRLLLMVQEEAKIEEIESQRLRIVKLYQQEVIKLSNTLKKSFEGAFEVLLKGEAGISGFFEKIGAGYRDTIMKQISGGLTEQIFRSTGIGDMFGISMTNLKNIMGGKVGVAERIEGGFESGSQLTYDMIVKGFTVGTGLISGGVSRAGRGRGTVFSSRGGSSQFGGMIDRAITIPGFGGGGWLSQPYGGMKEGMYTDRRTGRLMTGKGKQAATRGQVGGQYAGMALTGYSQYQSARAGGASKAGAGMQALGGMGLMAGMMGAFTAGGLASGAMPLLAGMGPVGWAIAGALLIGGMMMKGKKTTQTSITEKTTENRIASKIDVSNKNLEIINRNLVALRGDIQTYILPTSAYFAEKRSPDDIFALSSRRGLNT